MEKIVFIIPAMNLGGAEKSLVELLNIIDYEQYTVDLFLLEGEGILLKEVNSHVNILRMDPICSAFLKSLSESIEFLVKYKRFKLLIKRILLSFVNKLPLNINISHLTWRMLKDEVRNCLDVYDYAIAYLQGVTEYYVIDKIEARKKIFWMHTSFKEHSKNDKFEKKYITQYNKIICVSEAAKKDFIELFPDKKEQTYVFKNIIDKQKIKRLSLEKRPIPNDGNFHIVSVGRLHEAKGYDIAIEAFKKFHSKFPKSCFHIIGDGPLKEKLKAQIEKNSLEKVCFLEGKTINPYCYMKQADVILQSSRYEGYCIVLAEAKALFKPIITTDFFGAREQIKNNETGIIVECNVPSIFTALEEMYINKDLRQSFEKNLKEEKEIEDCLLKNILS